MRGRRRLFRRVILLTLLAVGLYAGGRWLLTNLYPLAYEGLIFKYAAQNGLDPLLVAAVIRTESNFQPRATSGQGARGLMQIMPETGRWAASQMKVAFSPDDLYDPEYNIRLGSWYLAELLREFGNDPVLALAAYNGGRGNVRKWLDERQWTGEHQTLNQIPFAETRHYVSLVLRHHRFYLWLYSDPQTKQGG